MFLYIPIQLFSDGDILLVMERIVLGIDPGLANTGWGVMMQRGSSLSCLAYGCVSTPSSHDISIRLMKIHDQIGAVISRFSPQCLGIETNLLRPQRHCGLRHGPGAGRRAGGVRQGRPEGGEFTPSQIKMAVVGEGNAEKQQVQYMVQQILGLKEAPHPDHAADALAAAICYVTREGAVV